MMSNIVNSKYKLFVLFLLLGLFVSCKSLFHSKAGTFLRTQPNFLQLEIEDWSQRDSFDVYQTDGDASIFIPNKGSLGFEKFFPAFIKPVELGSKKKSFLDISILKGANGFGWQINLLDNVDVYGGGEVLGPLLRNESDILLWTTDNYLYNKSGGVRLYQSHPWLLGVQADGSSFGLIFMSSSAARMQVKEGVIRFGAAVDNPFGLLILDGDSPQSVLEQLANWTGKMELPPLWALGYQQCRHTYSPDSRVKEIADEFRSRKIPCDVIWLDINYMDDYRIFTFDRSSFPNPKEVNDYLHQKKFHSVWMVDPGVKVDDDYFVYNQGTEIDGWVKEKGGQYFSGRVWPEKCYFPDYTQKKVAQWWSGLYKDFLVQGVDGVWNDMNEPSVFDGPDGTMPVSNQHLGGIKMENGGVLPAGEHLQYHNLYGMLMVKASKEGLLKANPHKRPFILSRSNFLGGQRYAATWTGDNCSQESHLALSIPMSLTLGLSGQPFNGPDLGGFGKKLKGHLMSQWMGVGVFFPFVRAHASSRTNDKEPWVFGKEVEDICREAIQRRYALLPYYYTLFKESSESGLPIMRPLFFADIKDPRLRNQEKAFLVGDNLIVLPQFKSKGESEVYLPKGDWKEIQLVGENPNLVTEHPQLLLKDGTAIPTIQPIQSTVDYSCKKIYLYSNFDKEGKAIGYLYEDDGDGFGYREGDSLLTKFVVTKNGKKLSYQTQVIKGRRKTQVKEVILIDTEKE